MLHVFFLRKRFLLSLLCGWTKLANRNRCQRLPLINLRAYCMGERDECSVKRKLSVVVYRSLPKILTCQLSVDVNLHCHSNCILACKSSHVSSRLRAVSLSLENPWGKDAKQVNVQAWRRAWHSSGERRSRKPQVAQETARSLYSSYSTELFVFLLFFWERCRIVTFLHSIIILGKVSINFPTSWENRPKEDPHCNVIPSAQVTSSIFTKNCLSMNHYTTAWKR